MRNIQRGSAKGMDPAVVSTDHLQLGTQRNEDVRTRQDSDYVCALRVRRWRDTSLDYEKKNEKFTVWSMQQRLEAFRCVPLCPCSWLTDRIPVSGAIGVNWKTLPKQRS